MIIDRANEKGAAYSAFDHSILLGIATTLSNDRLNLCFEYEIYNHTCAVTCGGQGTEDLDFETGMRLDIYIPEDVITKERRLLIFSLMVENGLLVSETKKHKIELNNPDFMSRVLLAISDEIRNRPVLSRANKDHFLKKKTIFLSKNSFD